MWLEVRSYPEREAAVSQWLGRGHHLNCVTSVKTGLEITAGQRTDCGLDRSNFRLAGHVDRSKFSRIKNEINLRFLLISFFSCYLSSRCVLQNFNMKSW